MSAMIPLKSAEKEAVVEVLNEEIRQYREVLSKPDIEGESANNASQRRWKYTRKLEILVAALTKIESQATEVAK
jgi:hypothetical protein